MRADKFKKWLENKGCRFDQHEKERGDGNASLMVKLGDKRSVLPFIGTNKNIGSENMDRILQELGLDGADVPDHVEGEKAKQEERHDRLPDRKAKAAASAAKKSKA